VNTTARQADPEREDTPAVVFHVERRVRLPISDTYPAWKKGNGSRSPYENAAAAMHALHSSRDVTRSELREIIAAGTDYHQVIRVWRWLLDSGFAVPGGKRGRSETLCLAPMWRGPRDEKPNGAGKGLARSDSPA
jgi:hypothetical protein